MFRLVKNLVSLARRQPFVPIVNRQPGQFAQLSGESLRLRRSRARLAGKVQRVADDDSGDREAPAEARQGAQVLSPVGSPAAAPLKREHRLRRQAQLV